MLITYNGMHCKRCINPPRHAIDKYLNPMHLSIDVITSSWWHLKHSRCGERRREADAPDQRWNLYFTDKLGKMNKYFIEHLFKHIFYSVQLMFLRWIPLLFRCPCFVHWRLKTCHRNRSFKRAYTQQIVTSFYYSTSHTFLYSLMLIPSIPLLADTYACFACLSWCWLSWCWSWLKVGQCWLYTD